MVRLLPGLMIPPSVLEITNIFSECVCVIFASAVTGTTTVIQAKVSRYCALLSKLLHVNISPLIEILTKCESYSSTALNHRAAF